MVLACRRSVSISPGSGVPSCWATDRWGSSSRLASSVDTGTSGLSRSLFMIKLCSHDISSTGQAQLVRVHSESPCPLAGPAWSPNVRGLLGQVFIRIPGEDTGSDISKVRTQSELVGPGLQRHHCQGDRWRIRIQIHTNRTAGIDEPAADSPAIVVHRGQHDSARVGFGGLLVGRGTANR